MMVTKIWLSVKAETLHMYATNYSKTEFREIYANTADFPSAY